MVQKYKAFMQRMKFQAGLLPVKNTHQPQDGVQRRALLCFKVGELVGGVEIVLRIFVQFEAAFRLAYCVIPNGTVMVGILSVFFQLP